MRKARAKVGALQEVPQDFDICFPALREDALDHLAVRLKPLLPMRRCLSVPGFTLNDAAVQHYHKGSGGIGIHRDALRYQGLVFIITLAGESRFCCVMTGKVMVPAPLMTAPAADNSFCPGFNGRDGEAARPHFVDQVEGGVFRSVCADIKLSG